MKIPEKTLRTVKHGYLYANGYLVLVHEEKHRQAGRVEWVTVHRVDHSRLAFTGRIILQPGAVRLALSSSRLEAHEAHVTNGSDNTRARGIAIGSILLQNGPRQYTDRLYIPIVDGLSGDWTYQPANAWQTPDSPYRWGGMPVVDGYPTDPAPSAEA